MTRYKVNLVHFVDAPDPDTAIAAARDGREPVIGEAIRWGSDRATDARDLADDVPDADRAHARHLASGTPGVVARAAGDPRDVAAGVRAELAAEGPGS